MIKSNGTLSGAFRLQFCDEKTIPIAFNADSSAMQQALQGLSSIPQNGVRAQLGGCNNQSPQSGCSWIIYLHFDMNLRDVCTSELDETCWKIQPLYQAELYGNGALMKVETLVKPQDAQTLSGYPKLINVTPGLESSSVSTAYGRGLSTSIAGVPASFYVQLKDLSGNNLEDVDRSGPDVIRVEVFPTSAAGAFFDSECVSNVIAQNKTIQYLRDGLFNVTYTALHATSTTKSE